MLWCFFIERILSIEISSQVKLTTIIENIFICENSCVKLIDLGLG